jgi:hypothetical protein
LANLGVRHWVSRQNRGQNEVGVQFRKSATWPLLSYYCK